MEVRIIWLAIKRFGRGIWLNTSRVWDALQDAAKDDMDLVQGLAFQLTVRQWVNADPKPDQLAQGQTFVLTPVGEDLPF